MAEPLQAEAVEVADRIREAVRRLKRMEKMCRQDARSLMDIRSDLRTVLASYGVQLELEPGIDQGGQSHDDKEEDSR